MEASAVREARQQESEVYLTPDIFIVWGCMGRWADNWGADLSFGYNTQLSVSTPQHTARHSFYYSFPAGNWVNILKPKQTKKSHSINNNWAELRK